MRGTRTAALLAALLALAGTAAGQDAKDTGDVKDGRFQNLTEGQWADLLRYPDSTVRRRAADALGRFGPTAAPALIGALRDPDERVRRHAADGLVHVGTPAVAPMTQALTAATDSTVRYHLADALGRVAWTTGQKSAGDLKPIADAVTDPLLAALDDRDRYTRSAVAITLGFCGAEKALPALTERALRDDSSLVRSAATSSLVRISPDLKPVIPTLIQALHDAEVSDRATGLLTRATPVAIDPLLAVVRDPNEPQPVRARAVAALGGMGGPGVPKFLEALKNQDLAVRRGAAYALSQLASAGVTAAPALLEATKDADPAVRAYAVLALGKTGDTSAIPTLLAALKDADPRVRQEAVAGLQALDPIDRNVSAEVGRYSPLTSPPSQGK